MYGVSVEENVSRDRFTYAKKTEELNMSDCNLEPLKTDIVTEYYTCVCHKYQT